MTQDIDQSDSEDTHQTSGVTDKTRDLRRAGEDTHQTSEEADQKNEDAHKTREGNFKRAFCRPVKVHFVGVWYVLSHSPLHT